MEEFVLGPVAGTAVDPVNSYRGMQCPSCGEFSVENDTESSQLVCTWCGRILEQSLLVSDPSLSTCNASAGGGFNSSSLPDKYLLRNITGQSRGYRLGIRRVKLVGQVLSFTPVMIEEASSLFKASCEKKCIYKIHVYNKETVAACCVYIVARRNGWPIAKSEIAHICQRKLNEVAHWFNVLKDMHGLEITNPDIEEFAKSNLASCGFSEDVLKTTIAIIKLAKSVWIDTGRRPLSVIYSAAYIAYLAHLACKKAFPVTKFCKTFSIVHNKSLLKCTGEIYDVLIRLGSELPWVDITKKNVHIHVPEILSYQKSLLHSIIRRYENQLTEDTSASTSEESHAPVVKTAYGETTSTEDKSPHPSNPEAGVTDNFDSDNINVSHNVKKRHFQELTSDVEENPKLKITKMENDILMRPRSFIRNRKKSSEVLDKPSDPEPVVSYQGDINACELSGHDIPEEELHKYIKTESEINFTVMMSKND